MYFVIYASICAFWICWLALCVVKARRESKVRYGDGGVETLMIAKSAHANATETIPIALILLFGLELNDGAAWLVHLFGITLCLGRIIHGKAMLANQLKGRVVGMQITVFTIVALTVSNLIYLPFIQELLSF